MTTSTEMTISERAAVALNSAKVTSELRELVASSADIVAVIDGAGREQAHRIGMNLKNARIAIEKAGKAARDDATKFSKGVIAEEARLVAIIEPEESRVFDLRDKWDAKIEAEKQAKIAAERIRIEAIQARIKIFSDLVLKAAGQSSETIAEIQETLAAAEVTEEFFEEFIPQANEAKSASSSALEVAYKAAYDAEQAIEAARIKREEEDRQREAQAAENARVAAENARIAAEHEKERQRLAQVAADQAAELARVQKEADDKIKANAAIESARIKAESDARAAEHAKAVAELEAQRKAFEAQQEAAAQAQAAAAKVIEDAARLESDHTEALAMNAAMIEFPKATDDSEIESLAELVDSGAVADVLIIESFDFKEPEPSDEEIVAFYVEAFGGTSSAAIERLSRFSGDLIA